MKNQFSNSSLLAVLVNTVLIYAVYMVCRLAFLLENWDILSMGWGDLDLWRVFLGSLRFDTSAICYTNSLYWLFMLVPLGVRRRGWWQGLCKWVFVIVNSLAVAVNLADAVYSQFTGRRTTATFFSEFQNDNNLGSVIGVELLGHWYLVLLGLGLIFLLWSLYRKPLFESPKAPRLHVLYNTLLFLAVVPLSIIGIRGGASTAVRPIAMSNAMQYVNEPKQAALVLNTPFSFIRTLGKQSFEVPHYFDNAEEAVLQSGFSSHHGGEESTNWFGSDSVNVVILILESMGQEYIGAYNDNEGYTPFLDSLISQSLAFHNAFANGRKSIDAMPSVLSSIPMFVEPFVVTPYGLNKVRSIASELGAKGYHSAFFHGAENGSMGFEAFAHAAGFQQYFGRSEYEDDARFGGKKDFDGTWAIWDEEFLQFYALKMGELKEPFVTSVFTASSHHPFVVPPRYEHSLATSGHPMYRCVRYVDQALRKFFATCSQQPWYRHTLFVITADHTNISERPDYQSPLGAYRVPIIFFDPSGRLPRGWQEKVAQQIDIMPTLLSLLGTPRPYIAYGKNLLDSTGSNWAVNYSNGVYQYVTGNSMMQYDGERAVQIYDYPAGPSRSCSFERSALSPSDSLHLLHLQGIIYDYMRRMTENELVIKGQQ